MRRNSIFHQLFLSYGSIFLLLFVTLFSVLYFELSHFLSVRASKELALSATSKQQQLDSTLNQHLINLKSWANLDVMDDFITHDTDFRITRMLESLKRQHNLSGHLYALSNKGELISADHRIEGSPDYNYWLSAMRGEQHLIDKHLSPVSHKLVLALWQPVYASFNKSLVIGYLLMTYPWNELSSLHEASVTKAPLLLFNDSGDIIFKDSVISFPITIKDLNYRKQNDWAGYFNNLIFKNPSLVKKNSNQVTLEGNEYIVVKLQPDKASITSLWQWYTLADKTQLYKPLYQALKTIFIFALISFLFIIAIVFYISRKISKPIQTLTNAAVNIALTLDLSKRVPLEGNNEFYNFAKAFNDMCLKLQNVWEEKNIATKSLELNNQQLEQKIAERTEHLAWQATHDPLTNLPNRTLLSERLSHAISRSKRDQNLLAILFIDLDGFKAVNDNFGHDKGDFLLIELASRLTKAVREPDTIARLGGDEFVLLLQINSLDGLSSPLARIVKTINTPFETESEQLHVSPSIGITIYPDDASDADGLIRHADQAMYDAKQKGRNQVQYFNIETDYQIHSNHKQCKKIKQALADNQFVLHYQPQINLENRLLTGAEALIRWNEPEQGLIYPDKFLPIIENSELIVDVGRWVIKEACQQLQLWSDLGLELKLSINIACRHIQHPDFFNELVDTLEEYPNVQPAYLMLEITESAALENITSAKVTLQKCHDFGVKIALDDFGTGYSSLTYLKQLPISLIKIDKSFVIEMLTNFEDKAIVAGIISLANAFKQSVVAEGIETSEHSKVLKEMKCGFGQGYGISRPIPSNDFLNWIKNYSN